MALPVLAVMAALKVAQEFVDFPLVKRLLENVAAKTTNKIDDWIVCVLYGTPKEVLPAALVDAQKHYDAAAPATVAAMKAEPSTLPWIEDQEPDH